MANVVINRRRCDGRNLLAVALLAISSTDMSSYCGIRRMAERKAGRSVGIGKRPKNHEYVIRLTTWRGEGEGVKSRPGRVNIMTTPRASLWSFASNIKPNKFYLRCRKKAMRRNATERIIFTAHLLEVRNKLIAGFKLLVWLLSHSLPRMITIPSMGYFWISPLVHIERKLQFPRFLRKVLRKKDPASSARFAIDITKIVWKILTT